MTNQRMARILNGLADIDWGQVVRNGGPPCFYFYDQGYFCLRALQWGGHHGKLDPAHPYTPLVEFVRRLIIELKWTSPTISQSGPGPKPDNKGSKRGRSKPPK